MKNKIAVLGNDSRFAFCVNALSEKGYNATAGSGSGVSDFDNCIKNSIACVVGVPMSRDDMYLSGVGNSLKISLEHFFERCSQSNACVFGGLISAKTRNKAEKYGVRIFDYQEDEAYLLRNAKCTATASLSLMMNTLTVSPDTASALIIGNGRVGKALSHVLCCVGTDVTVCARSKRDLAYAHCSGCDTVDISRGICDLPYCDIVFNTVPNMIFDTNNVGKISENAFVCNLASRNGGFSDGARELLGERYLCASSLPGKIFPETAGYDLAEAVSDIIEREGLL
ncbi:MAG: dipicolinate synthase subunit DpsA [Clostridia bacterium]|nr:dipicolinate synthase subunit DpsA [Clostridia bacterium]